MPFNETISSASNFHNITPSFGLRLKKSREALALSQKEVAAKLRLKETIIAALEEEQYPDNMPITFIRGYIRAYAKLLNLNETEVNHAIDALPAPEPSTNKPNSPLLNVQMEPMAANSYLMTIITYLILFTLLGLIGTWWYSHNGGHIKINNKTASSINLPDISQATLTKVNHSINLITNQSINYSNILSQSFYLIISLILLSYISLIITARFNNKARSIHLKLIKHVKSLFKFTYYFIQRSINWGRNHLRLSISILSTIILASCLFPYIFAEQTLPTSPTKSHTDKYMANLQSKLKHIVQLVQPSPKNDLNHTKLPETKPLPLSPTKNAIQATNKLTAPSAPVIETTLKAEPVLNPSAQTLAQAEPNTPINMSTHEDTIYN